VFSLKSLDPQQQKMLMIGVPVVGVAALWTIMQNKKGAKPAADAAGTTTVMTGPPVFGTQASDTWDAFHQLTAYLADLAANGGTPASSPAPPTSPDTSPTRPLYPDGSVGTQRPPPACAMNGLDGNPSRCSDDQLMAGCVDSGGHPSIIDELFRRGHSVNDPRFGGANPNDCGRRYVLKVLSSGRPG
jgi:hypothetical protein